MLVSEQPSSRWQGFGLLLQTPALCKDLPPLQFLLNNQSLQITGHLSPAHIHYNGRKTAFVTLIISACSFFPYSLNVRLRAPLTPTRCVFCLPVTLQRLRRRARTVRWTHHSLTHRCSLTGVRTSAQTSDGWRWRRSSTTAIMATSVIASLSNGQSQTSGLMGKIAGGNCFQADSFVLPVVYLRYLYIELLGLLRESNLTLKVI